MLNLLKEKRVKKKCLDEKGDTPSQTSIFYGEGGGGPDFISKKLIKGWDELITDIDSEEKR